MQDFVHQQYWQLLRLLYYVGSGMLDEKVPSGELTIQSSTVYVWLHSFGFRELGI